MKPFPKINLWLHIVNGIIITALTFAMSLLAFKYYMWETRPYLHSILGFIVLVNTGLVSLFGFTSWRMMLTVKWRTQTLLKMKKFHAYSGYGLIIIS